MRKISSFVLGILVTAFSIEAQTTIENNAEVSGTWTIVNSPYYINGLATVPPGDSLIIDPGVEIRFKTGDDNDFKGDSTVDVGLLYVKGKLIAAGTSSQRITFTRQGDSGNWGCIAFSETADTSSSIKYCKVEYAYRIYNLESKYYLGALSFRNPKVSISHSEIITNNWHGIFSSHTTLLIQNCIIAYNRIDGINISYSFNSNDTIIIANNTVIGNGSRGLTASAHCKIVNNIFWDNYGSFSYITYTSVASYNLVQEDYINERSLIIGEGMLYNLDPHLGPDYFPQHNSPGINAGTQDTFGLYLTGYDFLGNNRINQSRIDIGAVESDAPKFICLHSPNGEEGFLPGSNQAISWKSNVENLKLEYTYDNGNNWVEIIGNIPNDGLYNWIVPLAESKFFSIRISDVTDNSVFDVCDDNFIVFTSNIPDSTFLSGRLTIDHSPYNINGIAIVPIGDSLIIDPGVEIRFKTGDDFSYLVDKTANVGLLYIKGKLIAEGTSSQRIIFTRQGDSGNWGCIAFSEVAARASLRYCKLEFANKIDFLETKDYEGALTFRNPGANISHSEVSSNNSDGIYSRNSTLLLHHCIFANNDRYGLYISSAYDYNDTIIIENNTIVGNGSTGLNAYARCKIFNNIFWNNISSINDSFLYGLLAYNLVQEDVITARSVKIGEGMILNLNPQFIDSENNDYHLDLTSPCIDAGDPNYTYAMEPPENGGRINIGAYGNTDEASTTQYLPRINFLSKNYGRIFGRDTITIKGSQFLSSRGSGGVIFDNTESAEYLYWSDDSIICISPQHLPGIVDINIINSDDKKGFGKNCFSFLPPVLNKRDPISSNTSGDQQIIFSGDLFGHSQNGIQVLFDQFEAPLYHTWNDDTIVLNSPPHSEGLVDITFKLNDSIYYNFNESFLYSDNLAELCGEISDTLFNSQSYVLTCPVTIPEGQTLTIEPGVIIIAQHDDDTLISITSDGIIQAIGTESDSVKIISFPQYKGSWEGIIINNQGVFDYCKIKNGINGISIENGNLELKNSTIINNTNAGLNLIGDETSVTINVENTHLLENKYGIYAEAACNWGYGNVSANVFSCNILKNEIGIDLYSYGYTGGFTVPISRGSRINFTLKKSVVSNSERKAIKIRSSGFSDSGYSPTVHRHGNVDFISENCIIFNNGNGILARRENTTHCTVNTMFYNSVMFNNNSIIEMDADKVFMYNTNLWDNGISGNPIGICDSLVVAYSDLNSLENIPNSSNNISTNPMYKSTESGDFHLSENSPCIDAGSNEFVYFETDFDSKVRIWNATEKDSAIVDIGPFEYDTPCYASTIDIDICEGENYKGYTESGIYQFNYTNVEGCDSIVTTKLTVHPTYHMEEQVSICEGATYKGWTVTGQYTENLTSVNGCDSIVVTHLFVDKIEIPKIEISGDTLVCKDFYYKYQWRNEFGIIEGATFDVFIVQESGVYYLEVFTENECSAISDAVNIVLHSTDEIGQTQPVISIYPNPGNGKFRLKVENCKSKELYIQIYDNLGKVAIQKELHHLDIDYIEEFNLSSRPSGNYFINIRGDDFTKTFKLMLVW